MRAGPLPAYTARLRIPQLMHRLQGCEFRQLKHLGRATLPAQVSKRHQCACCTVVEQPLPPKGPANPEPSNSMKRQCTTHLRHRLPGVGAWPQWQLRILHAPLSARGDLLARLQTEKQAMFHGKSID